MYLEAHCGSGSAFTRPTGRTGHVERSCGLDEEIATKFVSVSLNLPSGRWGKTIHPDFAQTKL